MQILVESNFSDVQVITESVGEKKNWYIEGVFLQEDIVNRNKRRYPRQIMEQEVNNYIKNWVEQKRAVGELSHPDTIEINLDKITHITESIMRDGSNYIGKAKILNTPCGKIVEGLLEGGVRLGVSSRATGSVRRDNNGINEVQSDFSLRAIDVVFHPSAPDAMVEGLMEGASYIWDTTSEDTLFLESLRQDLDKGKGYKSQEKRYEAFVQLMNKISGK